MIRIHCKAEKFGNDFACDLAVVNRVTDNYGLLRAVSLAATAQEVQAIAAGLADSTMAFHWDVSDSPLGDTKANGSWRTIQRWKQPVHAAPGGFDVRKQKLAYDTWQLVAVSKDYRFLLHETNEALWKIIRSDKFTTPLLRSWVPSILGMLHENGGLTKCDFFGRHLDQHGPPALLLASDATLDKVVSDGVSQGRLRIAA